MCNLCKTKPVYEFTNQREVCKTCFIHWFEKKFLYTIRRFKLIQKNDVVDFKKSKNFRDVVLKFLLEMYCEKNFVELRERGANKFAVSKTADIESEKILEKIISGNIFELDKKKNKKNISKSKLKNKKIKIIKPLFLFLDKEVLLYAKLKKFKFENEKLKFEKISAEIFSGGRGEGVAGKKTEKKNNLKNFINELETKHPEVKNSVVKSFVKIFGE